MLSPPKKQKQIKQASKVITDYPEIKIIRVRKNKTNQES